MVHMKGLESAFQRSTPGTDVVLQHLDALMDSSADELIGQVAEPALDLIGLRVGAARRTGLTVTFVDSAP